ncbi:efflux RND transporter periplasmic adaptor subunit [Psychromonas sp. Urea-02u-13]|uniref:efflux RND transporter periplasmic adaptor subunit n=1 Tax=Psychromonas sp. Urea-02u-13 TaxID=2058326 RepID=UPI000C33F338|nr:efflux RND transporter periplasmic adaptor subunit [Psychromonas sp. Urea-02u-13]PKG40985.1 efflux transporter periplasmic adaptor subunit [Psychromonas sp. Urea-02u-13]
MNKPALLTSILILFSVLTSSVVSAKPNARGKARSAVPVYSEVVNYHQVSQSLSLIGKLQSDNFVSIATEVAGKVSSISVKANQKVQEGQLLFTLDDRKAQAALLEAQAYLADEKRKLSEYKRLVKSNAVTQSTLDAQSALVDIAQARLTAAQTGVSYHHLLAPFSGTIGLLDFSRGQMVSVGSELLTLDDLSVMQLDLQIPERYLSLISKGMKVQAKSRAWAGESFSGKVVAIDSRINPDTLNLRIRVQFDNQNNKLKPGMMMSAEVVFPAINEPIIPVQALEYSGTKRFVYLIDATNKVRRTEVMLGGRIKDSVLIESGIEVGARIVVQGLVNMSDGLLIKDLSESEALSQDKDLNDNKVLSEDEALSQDKALSENLITKTQETK